MDKTPLHFSWKGENTVSPSSDESDESCSMGFVQNIIESPNNNFVSNQNEFSQVMLDPTLGFISRMLLEEEEDISVSGSQNEDALQNMEKLFYDILGQKYPPSPNKMPIQNPSQVQDNSSSTRIQELRIKNSLAWEFQKGVEEGKTFLPSINKLMIDLWASTLFVHPTNEKHGNSGEFKLELEEETEDGSSSIYRSRGKKNLNDRDSDVLEGPNRKLTMLYSEEPIRDDMFDKVLLNRGYNHVKEEIITFRETMQSETSSVVKNQNQEKLVDLRDLLIRCSQAVAINDHVAAGELIKKIRKHSSLIGDGMQRLAFILADGLEARLAGTGSDIYRRLQVRKTTASEILKAHHLKIKASPFIKVSYYFAKYAILNAAKNASKLHIIDLGIDFGFQWPSLIQHLSTMKDKIPKLRITGVDVPQPGFRPAERVKETGRRLEDYAKSFDVPFEYHGIASQNWETLSVEDFHIEKDEMLVVNTMYCFRNLGDETTAMNSARTRVLNLVREIKPNLFILGILNASYTSPVFMSRFRQVLLFFSSVFDMMDSTVPRDNKERQLIERGFAGRSAINVIACEGSERVDRPETYQQWQRRNIRAGFEQLPLDTKFVKNTNDKVGEIYDKRFFVDEDSQWLLQGWKGRVIYAISMWKPKES